MKTSLTYEREPPTTLHTSSSAPVLQSLFSTTIKAQSDIGLFPCPGRPNSNCLGEPNSSVKPINSKTRMKSCLLKRKLKTNSSSENCMWLFGAGKSSECGLSLGSVMDNAVSMATRAHILAIFLSLRNLLWLLCRSCTIAYAWNIFATMAVSSSSCNTSFFSL